MTNRLHLLKQPYRDIAERWVAALRSGEYRQGFAFLRSHDGKYCCLGVLQGPVLGMRMDNNISSISMAARCSCGLQSFVGHFHDNALFELNDKGTPFPQIADLIESVPVGLWRDECFESGRQPEDNSDG